MKPRVPNSGTRYGEWNSKGTGWGGPAKGKGTGPPAGGGKPTNPKLAEAVHRKRRLEEAQAVINELASKPPEQWGATLLGELMRLAITAERDNDRINAITALMNRLMGMPKQQLDMAMADPDKLTDAQLAAIIEAGKPIIDGKVN
jgi:hypothetical protein